jgi:hypothetical protein
MYVVFKCFMFHKCVQRVMEHGPGTGGSGTASRVPVVEVRGASGSYGRGVLVRIMAAGPRPRRERGAGSLGRSHEHRNGVRVHRRTRTGYAASGRPHASHGLCILSATLLYISFAKETIINKLIKIECWWCGSAILSAC